MTLPRLTFAVRLLALIAVFLVASMARADAKASARARPNVILVMADDMGWGDAGFMGNKEIRTPRLDAMAQVSLRFQRFYAAAPVCSPTRASCLTGRHPFRMGITFANVGHLPAQEITLARLLRALGYATGHFGKWHLGTLTTTEPDSNRGGPKGKMHYAPPWERDYDVCFTTEAKVPTWNPMKVPGTMKPYGTAYWTGPGRKEAANLDGDDSRVIMDRVLPFVRNAVADKKPFHAVVWFHTPHKPVVGGPEYLKQYRHIKDKNRQHYYACITAMDEQIGRLREELRKLGVANDTIIWFCSDNGPEGPASAPGSTGILRGRKRSLLEGGLRVPGLWEWPARIKPGSTDFPACTSDYLPTIVELLKLDLPDRRPLDGVSLAPLLTDAAVRRPRPIAFESGKQLALSDNRFVLYSSNLGKSWELYDIVADPRQRHDLAARENEVVQRMRDALQAWRKSCEDSRAGKDYRP